MNPDEQEMIGSALREAAERRPDKLTKEELDDIARFVRFAQGTRLSETTAWEGKSADMWIEALAFGSKLGGVLI